MEQKKIRPSLAGGFRDYNPDEAVIRNRLFSTIRKTFELFGYLPLETPGIEREEVLTGGDASFQKQLFKVSERNEKDPLALRFDLTVPLARFVAANQGTIPWPFRRYQIGPVWRGEQPQAGRYREFIQCDADIVGAESVLADAEIISLAHETLMALAVPRFMIHANNRKILSGLAKLAGFPPRKVADVLRAIDKLDKIGKDGVEAELESIGGDVKLVKKFLDIHEAKPEKAISAARKLLDNSEEAMEGLLELEKLARYLAAAGVSEKFWKIDFSVARGFGYYTGMVFEIALVDLPQIGSIGGGGRYDGLVNRFSSMNASAVGFSIGIDRLYKACEELKVFEAKRTAPVLVLNFDPESDEYAAEITAELHRNEIPAELYLGGEETLKGQLSYAVKNDFGIVVIAGSLEKKRGVAQVRYLLDRSQFEVSRGELARRIAKLPLPKQF